MAWLIAWVLMMFTAVSSVAVSSSEIGQPIPLAPDGRIGSGASGGEATILACDPDAGTFDDTNGSGFSPGSPGIVTLDEVRPAFPPEPVGVAHDEPAPVLPCPETGSPDYPVSTTPGGVVTSPPTDGVLIPPGAGDFPQIEPGVPEPDGDRKLNSPPIEGLDFVIREISPPQYVAQVTSALPDGCSRFAGYTVERDGTTITIEVWNSVPTGLVPCNMMYGYHPFSVELGSDFESGVEYTLVAGERELTFIAQ